MSNTFMAAAVIAGLVGASSAAVTVSVLSPSDTDSGIHEVSTKAELSGSDLATEIAALRQQNTELMNRVVDLEMSASLAGTGSERREPVAVATDGEYEAMKEELKSLLATMQGSSDVVAPVFRESVATVVEDIKAQEEAERDLRRAERRTERTEKRLDDLAEKLGLNPTQVNDLREHTLAIEEKRQAMFAEARELGEFGSMRENMRTLRDESNVALQGIFTPSQYQQYTDENLGGGGRGGFGGGGGGRDGGGGGGNNNGGGGGGRGRGGRGGF